MLILLCILMILLSITLVCHVKEIYPPELVLEKTTEDNSVCSYLDVDISVLNGQFNATVYDKRDNLTSRMLAFH